MLVISSAAVEAERLANQGTRVKAFRLDSKMLTQLTAIDGAVLIDVEGNCHAIGVILDGLSNPRCSPSRGARYNSAVRYGHKRKECMVIVKSEDGMLSVFPELRPQQRRREILDAISEFRTIAGLTKVDGDDFRTAMNWFRDRAIYLSAEQCNKVNRLRRTAEEKIPKAAVTIQYDDLRPHPDMDDSYLID